MTASAIEMVLELGDENVEDKEITEVIDRVGLTPTGVVHDYVTAKGTEYSITLKIPLVDVERDKYKSKAHLMNILYSRLCNELERCFDDLRDELSDSGEYNLKHGQLVTRKGTNG